MTLENYRKRYANLNNQISIAQNTLDDELASTKDEFQKLYKQQQELDKEWFVSHLDFILKYKKHFQSDYGLSDIIIDFLTFRYAGLVSGAAFNPEYGCKIFLKDLLKLWDEGFTYEGYPIIGYECYIHQGKKIIITYIKNCRIQVISTDYLMTQNPLQLSEEIMKKVRKANVYYKYPDWKSYKTIDVVRRKILDKREKNYEIV